MFELELQAFEREKSRLLEIAPEKYALIHRERGVVGCFDTEMDAIRAGRLLFGLDPIFVKQIVELDRPVQVGTPFMLFPLGSGERGAHVDHSGG